MRAMIKDHRTYSLLGTASVKLAPMLNDIVFFSCRDGDFSAVCKGRIFDYRGKGHIVILVDEPKPTVSYE